MRDYVSEFGELADQLERDLLCSLKEAAEETFGEILDRSPVVTGRFKGSNYVDIVERQGGALPRAPRSFEKAKQRYYDDPGIPSLPESYEYVFGNNTPYAQIIEFGDSGSRPAYGVFRVPLAEYEDRVARIWERYQKEREV